MSCCPSPAIQQRILANVDKIYAYDDHWLYGVSNQWMTNFKHQFKNESDVTSHTSIENSCPPLTVDAKIENNDFISEKIVENLCIMVWCGKKYSNNKTSHFISIPLNNGWKCPTYSVKS